MNTDSDRGEKSMGPIPSTQRVSKVLQKKIGVRYIIQARTYRARPKEVTIEPTPKCSDMTPAAGE
jgi:hypothetical protein